LSAALSPDGTRVAYANLSATKDEASGLWLLDVSRGTSTRFTFGECAGSAVWSADGRRIIFNARGSGLPEKASIGGQDEQLLQPRLDTQS